MSRPYLSLEAFRKRFKVVDPCDLAAQEPNKYYDPFIERDDPSSLRDIEVSRSPDVE